MALTKVQLVDLNSNELILDLDADTSLHSSTDDQIDIKIGGADDFRFTANTFTALAGSSIVVPDSGLTLGSTAVTSTAAELNLLDGVSGLVQADLTKLAALDATAAEINLIDGGTSTGTTAVADADGIITNDGGTMRLTTAATFKTYFQEGISQAYDDFTIGDAAVLITTSAGNITIDAAANDSDIIFKGTDGGADKVFMTIDGSAGGDLFLTGGLIDLKNDGSAVSQIKFYCESSNAHAQTLIGAPHSEAASNTLTLPGTGGDARLVSTTSTATLTNKTFTSPKINEDVAVTSTATEINLIDGGATVGTTAIADGDGLIINDAGTMRVSTVQTLAAYLDDEITSMPNLTTAAALVTVSALDTGSITSGFGAIDNGTSNIRSATITAETAFVPDASGGADLGTTALEFNDAFFNDGAVINFGDAQDVTLTHTADTGLTLNSTMKLMFNDATQFIQGSSGTVLSIAATDEIDLTATAVDLNGTLNVSGVATFQAAPVFPDGSIAVADLDIDGATDIGAAIVDADLLVIDDGAGGTNRKTAASRLKTYIGNSTPVFRAHNNANQVIANNSDVTVRFNQEDFDPQSTFNTSDYKFTPAVAGKYFLTATVRMAAATDGGINEIYMRKNSSTVASARTNPGSGNAFAQTINNVVVADTDDEFYIQIYQNTGGNVNCSGGDTATFFTGFKLLE
jgi:hypothetical protein